MNIKTVLIFLLFSVSAVFADDIIMKNGKVWVNVKVLEIENNQVKVKKTSRAIITLAKETIESINKIEVDWYLDSELISKDKYLSEYLNKNNERISYIDISKNYIPLSIVSLILGIDYIATSKDYDGIIKKFKKQGINASGEKSIRDRKKAVGYALLGVSVISAFLTVFSVKEVRVKSENSKVILSYNF